MKKWLFRLPFLLGGVVAGVIAGLLMPVEWRAKLSQPLALVIRRMIAQMPDG
ncbi:MAG: hypothetical protein MUO76_07480 [Anaerolineaceae bacterium]|nr:hypothetical protein [Anaerolineaceae bacterium]